jgi:hypothetical protein
MTEPSVDSELLTNIDNVFKNVSYSEKYSFDLAITIVAFLITFFVVFYFYINNLIALQKVDWESKKCNPFFMPLAGKMGDSKDGDAARNNFNQCMNDLNHSINADVQKPIQGFFSILGELFKMGGAILANFFSFISYLFNLLFTLFMRIIMRLRVILVANNVLLEKAFNFVRTIGGMLVNIVNLIKLAIESLKLSVYMFALGFLAMGVIPSLVALTIAIIVAIVISTISYIMASIFTFFAGFPFAWMPGVFVSSANLIVAVSAAVFALFLILYIVAKDFAIDVLKKTVGAD